MPPPEDPGPPEFVRYLVPFGEVTGLDPDSGHYIVQMSGRVVGIPPIGQATQANFTAAAAQFRVDNGV